MKNPFIGAAVFLSLLWGLAHGEAEAQNSISYTANSAVITFNIADYTFENSDVNQLNLSTKPFVSIAMADEEYGIVADDGYPAIPQLPLLINIPVNAKNVSVSMRNAVQNQLQVPSGKYIEPFVNLGKDGTVEGTGFNATYYNTAISPYVSYFYATEEPFLLFDEQALDLTILPFQYVPTSGQLTVLQSAEFVITWTLEGSAAKGATTQARDDFFKDVFMSYESRATKGGKKGRLLIITAPQYEQGLSLFKQYKENIGIETQVVTTASIGNSVSQISNYIKNNSFKPDFVLLVGSINDIPHASGNTSGNEINNPVTDYEYRCFKSDKLIYGDVCLGRWPVTNNTDLSNIINKTIKEETQLHTLPKDALLVSGRDYAQNANSFNRGNDYAAKGLEGQNYTYKKIYQQTWEKVMEFSKSYPAWFIYAGHGDKDSLLYCPFDHHGIKPDFFKRSDIYPFLFAFTCFSGSYTERKNMACSILNRNGPVSYFGSTVQTMNHSDEAIEKKIFKKSFDQIYIGTLITVGMTKYAKRFWSAFNRTRTKRYLRSYNLIGDPSLQKQGCGVLPSYQFDESFFIISGIQTTLNSTNTIVINQGLQMETSADLTFKPENHLLLNGTIATNKGTLTGESKKITLQSNARINSGSIVKLTASDFDFKSGMVIESGSDVVFQAR